MDRSGQGVSGKTIFFKSSPNDAFTVDTSLQTTSGGYFALSLEIGDDITRGVITLSVKGCNAAISSGVIHYDPGHKDKKVRLLDCQGSSQSCSVRIGANRIDSTTVELTAYSKARGSGTYSWSTGETSELIQVTQPGTYCVKVEDSTGCVASDCITVGHPPCKTEIHVSRGPSVTDVASDKAFILTARTKGMAPFTYLWSTGDTSMQIRAVKADLYCVTVVDAAGCRSNDCEIVKGYGCAAKILVEKDDSLGSSAAPLLSVRTSGTPPYAYLWSTGETSPTIRAADSTSYCVTVVDSLGCTARDCIDLRKRQCGTEIRVGTTPNDFTNNGQKVLYAVTKGRAPFHFRWSTGDTTQRIVVDTAGEYCVEVVDANGCESSACTMVRFPPPCSAKIQLAPNLNVSDALTSDFVLAVRNYGRAPFKYIWSTGDTTKRIQITDAIEYCVTITDGTGCVAEDCLDLSKFADSCSVEIHRTRNGHLIAFPRPHFATSFSWSTGDSSRHIKIDSAGEYCVTVSNIFGCTASACITIPIDHDSLCAVKILRRKVAEGTLLIAASRGLGDFSFAWSTGDTSRYILVDSAGSYCVTAFTNTCKVQSCVDVNTSANAQGIGPPEDYHVYGRQVRTKVFPNPFKQMFNLSIPLDQPQELEIFIHRLDGKLVWRDKIGLGMGTHTLPVDLQDTPAGIYIVKLRSKDIYETFRMVKH